MLILVLGKEFGGAMRVGTLVRHYAVAEGSDIVLLLLKMNSQLLR